MEMNDKTVLICDCERSMRLDGDRLAKACGAGGPVTVNTQLCRAQIDNFCAAAGAGRPLIVACTQETPLFEETLDEMGSDTPARFVNIRENAGWSDEAAEAVPKMAALLAEAALDIPPAPSVSLKSEGVCLVYGRDAAAIEAARQFAGRLEVTVLLTRPEGVAAPRVSDLPVFRGTIARAQGHLGAFELVVDDYAAPLVSSRAELVFDLARNGASSRCDLILDLTGGAPLFPAPEKRDGYFRPDPGDPAAVQRALFELVDLVGEFEKPRYVAFDADLCAHARSGLTGCTRCIDVCPAGAIEPAGDVVAIDPYICGGCGGCNSVCPTGAASYAMPPNQSLIERLDTLLTAYHAAGGRDPVLLVHDPRHGAEAISLMARHGRGLPANVLPFAVNEVTQAGLDLLVAALAKGAARVLLLAPPARGDELDGLAAQVAIAEAVMAGLGHGAGRVEILVEADPEAVERRLHAPAPHGGLDPAPFQPAAAKRTLLRQALEHLHKRAPNPVDHLALPAGAPFGAVEIDAAGCTLCLSCVGACPTGALQDNPDMPELRFQEDACVQCGLCRTTCPEKVIALEPRLDFTEAAKRARLVKQEEPFHCVRCGQPFGTKASIEMIVAKLADRHDMFKGDAIERIKMCQDCRVVSQFEDELNPLAGGPRPTTRTTDDYLREREEIEAARAKFQAEQAGDDKDETGD